jgi:outer membrane scaffolding protein for murein synthesis (MipA/OmpV family)
MNHKLFTALSSLSITSALLAVGLMANGEAARLPEPASDSPLVESAETGAVQAA